VRAGEVLAHGAGIRRKEVGTRVEVVDSQIEKQVVVLHAIAHLTVEDLPITTAHRAKSIRQPIVIGERADHVASIAQRRPW